MFKGIFRSDLQKFVKKGSKFGPPGPKNGNFWPFFGHFCSFLDLKFFLVNEFFWFFYMMFWGIFKSDLQKIVKKWSKFGPPGPKNGHFWPFFGHFRSFSDLSIFRSDLQKIVKKGSKSGPPGPKKLQFLALFWPFRVFFGLRKFSSEWIFLIFDMMF